MLFIVLVVATAASITALFLRGFRVKDFTQQLNSKEVATPDLNVWLIETPNFMDKMDAYKAGIAAADSGFGVYVLPDNSKWCWVACVYNTEEDANHALQTNHLENAVVKEYSIKGKQFTVDKSAVEPCQQVLDTVQKVYDLLIELRTVYQQNNDTSNLQIDLTTLYNQIKSYVEALQTVNATIQSDFVATVIYTGNQNILGLQELVGTTKNFHMSDINNALLKTIFSLDNF